MLSKMDQYVIDRVRDKRIEHGWSQADLAYAAGFTPAFIGIVESPKNDKKYNLRQLNIFARVFNCSPKEFLPDIAFPPDEQEKTNL